MNSETDFVLDVVSRRLPAAGVDCLMIGGHAVNHYGVVRTTQDIDFMIAMKLFALQVGNPKRLDKDFPDIVHLVIENGLDALRDLQPLCARFGTPAIYDALCARIWELQS